MIGGATTSTATALNASDQVVGYYYTTASGGSASSPFVYTPGAGGAAGTVVTVPGTYTSYTSEATGINDAGMVVGFNGASLTAFTYNVSNGAFTSIPYGAGNYQIELAGVNASGIAVGSLRDTTTFQPSAIAYNTLTNTITNVGAGFSGESVASNGYSYSINNSGVIAATGPNASAGGSNAVPYIATPKAGGGYTYTDLSGAITASDPTFSLSDSLAREPARHRCPGKRRRHLYRWGPRCRRSLPLHEGDRAGRHAGQFALQRQLHRVRLYRPGRRERRASGGGNRDQCFNPLCSCCLRVRQRQHH